MQGMNATDILSLTADPIRRRILRLLLAEGALCVCELCAALPADQPKVSRHLARLRAAGLVEDRRAAQWVVYSVPAASGPALTALMSAAAALAGPRGAAGESIDAERARLRAMENRPSRAA